MIISWTLPPNPGVGSAASKRRRSYMRALVSGRAGQPFNAQAAAGTPAVVPLKEAKLNIEHNATDKDTGFQGAIDSEGWRRLDVRGPGGGQVLAFEGRGSLAKLGLTELFFEIGRARERGGADRRDAREAAGGQLHDRRAGTGERQERGPHSGTALLTHDIPAGPELVSPAEDATVPMRGLVARWKPVSKTITGEPVKIIAYQLIIEKDVEPHRHMIGKFGLSMYLPPSVTSIAVPNGFLEARTKYDWEVLAIERSGNQTLSSGVVPDAVDRSTRGGSRENIRS